MGLDLIEVHSVRIVIPGARDDRTEIYGTIKISDPCGDFIIYKQEREQAKSTDEYGTLPLEGPSRCLWATTFYFDVQLKQRNQHQDQDLDVGCGLFFLETIQILTFFEKRVRTVFRGKDGYSVLHYTIMGSALQAIVDVALIANQHDQIHSCRGSLIASNFDDNVNKYDSRYYRTTLLTVGEDEPPKELKYVGEQKFSIPLSRNVLAVRSFDKLIIEANLLISGSAEPVCETFTFKASSGYGQQDSETKGKINVTVTWEDEKPIRKEMCGG